MASCYLHLCMLVMVVPTTLPFSTVGYMPEWRYEGADFDRLCQHLTHLIFFSLEVTPKGDIIALDRLPRPELFSEAREAATRHQTKLLLCLGGNGRSGGFSVMVRNDKNRRQFVVNLVELLDKYQLDGVDYNWEYPGYRMGKGYMNEKEILKDYEGLAKLLQETREAFKSNKKVITMAYYPDTKQEKLINLVGASDHVDLLHSMSYDQGGPNHSPRELAAKTVKQADIAGLPLAKLCLGVPFYGRNNNVEGDWVTYEDLVQQHELSGKEDTVNKDGVGVGFNGKQTLAWKVKLAVKEKLGGVMIWEVGQDCRVDPVHRGDTVHVRTCPDGEDSSLLGHITRTKERLLKLVKDEF
eukprot:GFUD01002883.1.p1 GENE.GFUD01002883.1~~GFUD01002883.1.p1  ORF type:complete len:354 (+),score=133.72 GFUD01002883.1:52-1113(+)